MTENQEDFYTPLSIRATYVGLSRAERRVPTGESEIRNVTAVKPLMNSSQGHKPRFKSIFTWDMDNLLFFLSRN